MLEIQGKANEIGKGNVGKMNENGAKKKEKEKKLVVRNVEEEEEGNVLGGGEDDDGLVGRNVDVSGEG